MHSLNLILLILTIIGLPYLVFKLQKRLKWMDLFGSAFWCYIAGLTLSYTPLVSLSQNNTLSILMKLAIPLALPLFVFAKSPSPKDEYTKAIFKSFILLFFAVFLTSIIVAGLFSSSIEKYDYYIAMLSGTYIGGTINMAALHQIFNLPQYDFFILNTGDTLIGGIYLLMLLSILPKFYGLFLKQSTPTSPQDVLVCKISYCSKNIVLLLAASMLVVILSYLPTLLFPKHWESMIFFTLLTFFAFLFSKKINPKISIQSTSIGNYLLMIFCICIGAQLDLQVIANLPWRVIYLVISMLLGSMVFHLIFAKLFKVDRDIFIISHTAGIFGPVFIAPMASALNRNDLLISGIAVAVFGNITGNYAGLLILEVLHMLN